MKIIGLALLIVIAFSCKKEKGDITYEKSNITNERPITGLELTVLDLKDNHNLRAIHFIDDRNGFACGYDGDIIMTLDEGVTWSKQKSNTSAPLFGITFINNKIGFAVGGNSSCGGTGCTPEGAVILKTNDKGETWNKIALNMDEKIELNDVIFINDSVGFAIGGSTILKTTDTGNTWEPSKFAGLGGMMRKIVFKDSIGMIICSGGKLITTKNNGKTWTVNSTVAIQGSVSISLPENNVVYLSSNTKIFKSADLGTSWTELNNSPTDNFDINFTSQSTGFAVGRGNWSGGDFGHNYGSIFYTKNGGDSWTGSTEIKETSALSEIVFPTKNKGFIVGSSKIIKVEIK